MGFDPLTLGLIAATVVSAGVGVAGAAGAFDADAPDIPTAEDPRVEEQRQRQLRAARGAKGKSSTILAPLTEEAEGPKTRSATLLGQSATTGAGGSGGS